MRITIYDGADTIGGNKIYVEEDGRGVFLDFGMNFSRYGTYFADFLVERSARGIHDPLYLGLIPRLDVYRPDLIPSDVSTNGYPKLDVRAVLLSHAHADHYGNIGFLREDIPIVASGLSLAILKAMRDAGRSTGGSEVPYHSRRALSDSDSRVLKSTRDPYTGRDLVCTDKPSRELVEFLCNRPGQESRGAKKLEPGRVCCLEEAGLPFKVRAHEVDHSIYGAQGFVLYGDTTLAYTGDLRLHGKNGNKTKKFVKEARNASILITEGTRTGREEDTNVSEREVYQNCLRAVEESKGLVIADFSPRNFERLDMFKQIAKKTSRILVVTPRDAYLLHAIEQCTRKNQMNGMGIYTEMKDRREKWETDIVKQKWGDRYVDPTEIGKNPDGYILCFSFYDLKHLLDIKPDTGSYIYSSSEAHNEEQELDFLRLHNWLDLMNMKTYGFQIAKGNTRPEPVFTKGYHASGHAPKQDLEQIIQETDPDTIIPVHTQNPEWFVENFGEDKVKIVRNGETITF